jgi:alpha-D-ribose 1-methylphosphonate 5-triphosphate synthase subunit PhnH
MTAALPLTNGLFRHQRNFRTLLKAMSRPGKLRRLETQELSSPALALAECLLDHEVSFWVAGAERTAASRSEIAAETGSREAGPADADFVFVLEGMDPTIIGEIKRGRLESPEEAAMLVMRVDSRHVDPGERLRIRLTGPGIAEPDGIAPEMGGISLDVLRALAAANADYPLGVDAIFIRPNGELMCLPRSTRIQVR